MFLSMTLTLLCFLHIPYLHEHILRLLWKWPVKETSKGLKKRKKYCERKPEILFWRSCKLKYATTSLQLLQNSNQMFCVFFQLPCCFRVFVNICTNVQYSMTSTSVPSVGRVSTDASLITWFYSPVPFKDYTAEGIQSVHQNRNNSYTTFVFLFQSSKSLFGWSNNTNNYILYASMSLYTMLRGAQPTGW